MYLVLEIQKAAEGQLSTIITQHNDLRDAQSKYHFVLAAAAKSGLPKHSAAIIYEDGYTICNERYEGGEGE